MLTPRMHTKPTPATPHLHLSFTKRLLARLLRPALAPLEARVDSLKARLEHELERTKLGIWRGGLEGSLILPDGGDNLILSTRLRQELAFWRRAVRIPCAHPAIDGPFEVVFGRWQRARLDDLALALELDAQAFAAWRRERSAVELGSGPYPMLAASTDAPWRWALAVDPLADGYASEGLVVGPAASIPMLAACAEAVPLPAACADLVVSENALDHMIDPARALAEMRRLLTPRGVLWLLVDLSETPDDMHPHPMSLDRLRGLLAEQKLEVIRERVTDHRSHPNALGDVRVLARPGT